MSDKTSRSPRGLRGKAVERAVSSAVRRAVRSQSGQAKSYVAKLRKSHPDETPAQIERRLDQRFLNLATATGTAVGATGAVPGIGTLTALGAASAESALFLDATAFYTMAIAELHGIDPSDTEHEEMLVMTTLLGASGTALLADAVGRGAASGSLAEGASHLPGVGDLNRKLIGRMVRRFALKRATLVLGKAAPAGIGAAIGGWGNRRLASTVVDTAHTTFGAPPATWGGAAAGPPGRG